MTEAKMTEPLIMALQDKVVFDANPPPLPDRFTHRHGGTVTIRMHSGATHTHTCKAARGSGARGVEWSDVDEKYRKLVALSGLPVARVEESLVVIHGFDTCESMSGLINLLTIRR